jgi:polyisoprenoid-binding protein YceI
MSALRHRLDEVDDRPHNRDMKTDHRPLTKFLLPVVLALAPASAFAGDWTIDPVHSEVGFSVRHLMVSNVKGRFPKVSGTLALDDKDATKSKVAVEIDAASIDTRDEKRDQHLRSEDFFWAEKHPKITFKSTQVQKAGKGYRVTGDLTMRGVTKPVTLDVQSFTDSIKDPWGNTKRGLVAKTKLNRKDFGVAWNKNLDSGGVVVGDEVEISIELELNEAKTTPPNAG